MGGDALLRPCNRPWRCMEAALSQFQCGRRAAMCRLHALQRSSCTCSSADGPERCTSGHIGMAAADVLCCVRYAAPVSTGGVRYSAQDVELGVANGPNLTNWPKAVILRASLPGLQAAQGPRAVAPAPHSKEEGGMVPVQLWRSGL